MYKHLTAVSKNAYYDVLDYIVKKYNNTWHSTVKMKPKDVGDNNFTEYVPNWSEEVFVVNKIKNTVKWTYEINNLNGEKIVGSFYEKELQKTDQKEFRIEKVIRRKGDKLYVKWKGYDNSFNSWINKNDIIK